MFTIKRYTAADAPLWNDFVAQSKNGTFLLNRGYMDYHSDRFTDHSLLFFRDEKLYALLPANEKDECFISHGGLTYGGLIMGRKTTTADTLTLFEQLNDYLRQQGFHRVIYKPTPWIYQRIPAEEDLYALFRVCQARLSARSISSSIIMRNRLKWQHGRIYQVKHAQKNGIAIQPSTDYAAFWQVLEGNLQARYGVRPVHTLSEMELLHSRFPDDIKLYTATKDGVVVGGTVLYLTPQVLHSQYISATPEGKHFGAIDALFHRILNEDYSDYELFDFGVSTEENGRILNESLIYQKESFGARGVCYDTYEWEL